jgi:3-hydroxyacyl-CoA dehydrogenase
MVDAGLYGQKSGQGFYTYNWTFKIDSNLFNITHHESSSI